MTVSHFYQQVKDTFFSMTSGRKFKFVWDKYRFDKRIVAHNQEQIDSTAVIKVASQDDVEEWHENILEFINHLITSNKISNLNQIAFLFRSAKFSPMTIENENMFVSPTPKVNGPEDIMQTQSRPSGNSFLRFSILSKCGFRLPVASS